MSEVGGATLFLPVRTAVAAAAAACPNPTISINTHALSLTPPRPRPRCMLFVMYVVCMYVCLHVVCALCQMILACLLACLFVCVVEWVGVSVFVFITAHVSCGNREPAVCIGRETREKLLRLHCAGCTAVAWLFRHVFCADRRSFVLSFVDFVSICPCIL